MEYATNGSFGNTTTAYSFGVRRESFVETASGMGAGATMGGMTYQSSGTYYYTGTGSVANVTGTATNQSYSYTASGSMTAFAMSTSAETAGSGTSTLITNPTAYGTYGVYGYNGEYTHTSLGLQYLRARYLNVATGTFTSRDTYAGRMQDILSQNRYTYAENNPVGHSDPSGHAVMGSLITTAFRNATTSRADKARAATQAAVTAYANEQRNRTVLEQRNAAWIQSQEEALANRPVGLATYVAQQIASYPGAYTPWAQSISAYAEQKVCQAYNYCKNEFQEAIKGKDVARIVNGISLIEGSVMKMLGENALVQGGASVVSLGPVGAVIGVAGIVAGICLGTSSIIDLKQGINEIKLGWQGDYETVNPNILVETVYGGDANAYHTSTLAASLISVIGIPIAGTLDAKVQTKWKSKVIENDTISVDDFIKKEVNPCFQQNVREAFMSDAKVTILERDTIVYRYYGGTSTGKSYWYTPNQTINPAADLALPQGNSYQYMETYIIPKGTTILEGTVAPNFGQPGGGYQFYVPDPSVLIKK